MIKVLFTGGGGAGNEAIWRLLGDRYTLYFGDADVLAIDPSIPADRRIQVPWASDPLFIEKMIDICRVLNIDLLIPGVDEELLLLALNTNTIEPTRVLLPSLDYVKTMLDKLTMITALSDKKIPVPRSRTLSDDTSGICFPCISKPRNGRGSRDVRVLNSLVDVVAIKSTLGNTASTILLQDKIEGVEYTVQMVADAHCRLFAIVPVRVGIKRGITIRAETEAEPNVISACRAIHQAIPAKGCYNIQLILTSDGNVFPFEINPRISTTLCLVIAAGIDPIAVFLEPFQRKNLAPFFTGIQLHRHWTNYFLKEETNEI